MKALDEKPLCYFYKPLRDDAPDADAIVAAARGTTKAR